MRMWMRIGLVMLVALIAATVFAAIAAANIVPGSYVGIRGVPINPNSLKPTGCTINITNVVVTQGDLTVSTPNTLVLAGTGKNNVDIVTAGGVCVVAGAGNDFISATTGSGYVDAGPGNDHCSLPPGYTVVNCEH